MISPPQSNEATAKSEANSPRTNGHATTTPPQPEQRGERLSGNGGQGPKAQGGLRHGWQGLSLRTKVTALGIALGTLPVLVIGATAYYFANQAITNQIDTAKQSRAVGLADITNRFMFERFGDIQVLSSLPAFSNPQVSKLLSRQQKDAQLQRFVESYGFYDSIAVMNLNGDVTAQSKGKASSNQKDRDFFRGVLKTDKPFIGQPETSKATGKQVIQIAAPIKDVVTDKTIAIVHTRIPIERLAPVIANFSTGGDEYHLINLDNNQVFEATEKNQIGRDAVADFGSSVEQLLKQKEGTRITVDKIDGAEQLVAYSALEKIEGLPDLNWGALMAINTETAFAAQRQLREVLLIGTGITALLVGAIAASLARRATRPIVDAADAVKKLGQGQLDTRISVQGQDEVAELGSNINLMAEQIQTNLETVQRQEKQSRVVKDITLHIAQSLNLADILKATVNDIRQALSTDRVVVYRLDPGNWEGSVFEESVGSGWTQSKGVSINDPCLKKGQAEAYRKGRVHVSNNIHQEPGMTDCYIKQLDQFEVKANLVAPILADNELFGLLIAHQCSGPRNWHQSEIELFTQLATQVGLTLDRASLLEHISSTKDTLQRRALELLVEVDPVSRGDLTIRANVTEDEIGTVADSYNATIGSLRKIVAQVQTAAQQMADTTSTSEVSVQGLSTEALRQTEEITAALDQLQAMSNAIRAVAANAEQAEAAVQQANQTVSEGDAAMNRTVEGIVAIRETVAETSKKVKRLGESSQKISKVVNLIGKFADQTNLLALNASIEAALAGAEGRGFAVVANEVRSLARQSAEATAEIEKLVADIQIETNEVVAAMETGTEQVVTGTKLVDETRQSLNKITAVSTQISGLVQAIAQAAAAQSKASESVTLTMTDVAAISNKTSTEANRVSTSFKDLLAVAQELQTSAGQFKVS